MIKKISVYTFRILYILATLACIIYVTSYAEDRFESEAHFSVTKEDSTKDASTSLLGQLTNGSASNSDSQILTGYITSADLILELEKKFNLNEHYSSPKYDFLYRLDKDAPLEDRIAYYRKRIKVRHNDITDLTEITAETFNQELSKEILNYILKKSDLFINRMSQKIEREKLTFVSEQLAQAETKVSKNHQRILKFQTSNNMIDPNPIIAARLETINRLELEAINLRVKIASLKSTAPNSPTIKPLEIEHATLLEQLEMQKVSLSGAEGEKLNLQLAEFTKLKLELEFALTLKERTEALLEKTKVSSIANTRFFTTIQSPFIPEGAKYPKRTKLIITILLCSILIYSIISGFAKSMTDRM